MGTLATCPGSHRPLDSMGGSAGVAEERAAGPVALRIRAKLSKRNSSFSPVVPNWLPKQRHWENPWEEEVGPKSKALRLDQDRIEGMTEQVYFFLFL